MIKFYPLKYKVLSSIILLILLLSIFYFHTWYYFLFQWELHLCKQSQEILVFLLLFFWFTTELHIRFEGQWVKWNPATVKITLKNPLNHPYSLYVWFVHVTQLLSFFSIISVYLWPSITLFSFLKNIDQAITNHISTTWTMCLKITNVSFGFANIHSWLQVSLLPSLLI